LEHVTKEEAETYLSLVKIKFSKQLELIKKNDQFGNPDIYEFDKVGLMSPTTARYLKNTSDIVSKFGKNHKSIIEIGGGYGGLATVLYPFVKYDSYLIIDLYEVNLLSRRYLKNFEYPILSHEISEIELEDEFEFDLLISNYAFSECERDIQIEYINKFIRKTKKFYMIFNDFGPNNIHHEEFIEMMSDRFVIDMEPDHDPNSPKVLYGTLK
jgi:putative sugar O-methyltransferase